MLLTWTDFAWEQYEELQEKDKYPYEGYKKKW